MSKAEDRAQAATLPDETSPDEGLEGSAMRAPAAAVLAWLFPGAGHLLPGQEG